ncbi:MAG: hypothetical protein U1E60_14905 [Reyranellaceae bacterium]
MAPDNVNLTTGSQSVNFGNGNDTVVFGTGKFSGNMTNIGNAGDTTRFTGNADVSGVNGGGAITPGSDFQNASRNVTMTVTQHGVGEPFGNTGGTQTINLVNGGTTTGDAGIENYVLVTGAGPSDYTFTVPSGLGSQNVTVTGTGAQDTIRYGGGTTFTGGLTGLSQADGDIVQFYGKANIQGVNLGGVLNAKFANFNNTGESVTMTLAQHNDFSQPFTGTTGKQTITLKGSGIATGDAGIEQYVLDNGDDTFTVAPNEAMASPPQNVDFGTGTDIAVFGNGTFYGSMSNIGAGDTAKFTGGVADIVSINLGVSFADKADFNGTAVQVVMTTVQHNGFTQPFGGTAASTQTIQIATDGTLTGDVGIENYVLNGGIANAHNFTVAKDNLQLVGGKQNVLITAGPAQDFIRYGTGTFTGDLVGLLVADNDTVQFFGDADIEGVNGGAVTGGNTADFSDAAISVTMTTAQHQGFTPAFTGIAGVQTIVLTTSGIATGDGGIENYVLASGNDTFTVAKDNGAFKQNVDITSGGNDTLNYDGGNSVFTGNLVGGGAGDTVQFTGIGGGTVDVKGVNGGAKMGPKAVSFSNTAVDATMTVVQHNDFTIPFTNTGNGGGTQTIRFSTDGTATGDLGIEQYFLGADGTNTNNFTVGIIGQNVTGLGDNDTVINPFGGLSGVLKGGANTATGDTLILQAANTTLAAGSGEFENLMLTVTNGTLTSDLAAHNGFTGVINAPGNNTYTVNDNTGGTLTGLAQFENYALVSTTTAFTFTLTDAQTGTIVGSAVSDTINATAAQVGAAVLIDGGGNTGTGDKLNISTDAGGLNLNSTTANIEVYNLLAGSTTNVVGANGNNIVVNATGSAIFTMGGVGSSQKYVGGVGASGGIDVVTFNVASDRISTGDQSDIVTSLVGGNLTGAYDGGAGTDTLSLANGDNLSTAPVGVVNFETLVLANNASVTMTGSQYNQFTTLGAAPGINTITIEGAANSILTSTFAGVEHYILNGNLVTHAYTIAGSNQTVTDNDSSGAFNAATIAAGLTDVTLTAISGARYLVNDLGGGTNHSILLGTDEDVVFLAGGHTGIFVDLGGGGAGILDITGVVEGTLKFSGKMVLNDTADISDASVIIEGTPSRLFFESGSMSFSAATWDQFVAPDGSGNVLAGFGSQQTVTLTTTAASTAAFAKFNGGDIDRVEDYVLSNAGNDFFTVNEQVHGDAYNIGLDVTAGGHDFMTFNDVAAAPTGTDVATNVVGFTSGSGTGFDTLAVKQNGTPVSNAGFYNIATANTDINGKAAGTAFTVASSVATIVGAWSQAAAQTALDTAIQMVDTGTYTMTVYNGASADVMIVKIVTANTLTDAQIDLVGVLQNVGVNTLVAQNFS